MVLALLIAAPVHGQASATVLGRVLDASGAVIRGATVNVRDETTGFDRSVPTDDEGRYQVAAIPAGSYQVAVTAVGFKVHRLEGLVVEVGRTLVHDVRLEVGGTRETVVVTAERPLIDRATATVGHVVTARTVQEIPLNGRYFTDLGLLVPGSVAPSQTGFSSVPGRGSGPLAINTAGNREEAVAFLVNGVTTNNFTFGSLLFQPPLASIQEFKIDNSTFSAAYGHVSGAVVNIVTQSGANRFHGEAYEFFRNDALDARNFFELNTPNPHPFERNQFGGSAGGAFLPGRGFFFAAYEGLRQRQGEDMNSLVLSDAERRSVSEPAIQRLLDLIPRANFTDANGTARFVGSAPATTSSDRWTIDVRQNLGDTNNLHVFYGAERTRTNEPSWSATIPGFGRVLERDASILTVEQTHVLRPTLLNEARFGRSPGGGTARPRTELNPADLGIGNGVARPIGLPQMMVAGGLVFGGPGNYPTGRDDTSYVFSDTLTYVSGRHAFRVGGEYRHFINENFDEGTGAFNFPSVAAFVGGNANAFMVTRGERRSHIDQRAMGLFVQDSITIRPTLTLELGMRYEWHVTPTEQDDKFVVFDAGSASLLQVGVDLDEIYRQNNRNFEPRLGVAWSPSADGRTVVRAAYGLAVDEPSTTVVRNTTSNPPHAIPLMASGSILVGRALETTRPAALSPATVDPGFRNASLHSWNVNLQRQLGAGLAMMAGYFGSSGRNLRITRNLNQPVNGVRPFPALSPASPIRPNEALSNIMQVEHGGFSSYHALWLSASKRLGGGLQFDTSYTWSKSLDTNSLNSSGFAIQNGYDIPDEYGLSDFDARHRFVLSAIYELPFRGHPLTRGWQVAAIVQSQSGNPVNLVTSTSTINGLPNTVRPDVTGPIRVVGSVDQWFDPSVFVAVDRFGNLGRNVVIGPAFHNTDLSIAKSVNAWGRAQLQFRADVFDVFNHPNFGAPGNVVGSPTFGKITRTRFPTGEAGSSRQIQLAVKLSF
jgi:hypothetical protein